MRRPLQIVSEGIGFLRGSAWPPHFSTVAPHVCRSFCVPRRPRAGFLHRLQLPQPYNVTSDGRWDEADIRQRHAQERAGFVHAGRPSSCSTQH